LPDNVVAYGNPCKIIRENIWLGLMLKWGI
jgi:acetyltransferase-like isoleucine patch superfamily enzyme